MLIWKQIAVFQFSRSQMQVVYYLTRWARLAAKPVVGIIFQVFITHFEGGGARRAKRSSRRPLNFMPTTRTFMRCRGRRTRVMIEVFCRPVSEGSGWKLPSNNVVFVSLDSRVHFHLVKIISWCTTLRKESTKWVPVCTTGCVQAM